MTDTFTGSVKIAVVGALSNAMNLGTKGYNVNYGQTYNIATGTGANQANQMFADTRTLSASATETLDLSGILLNAYGETIAFTAIRAIVVVAAAGNTNNVVIGNAATNQWTPGFDATTDTISLKPGNSFCMVNMSATGWAVVGASSDLLKIANSSSGTGVTYDIILIGS